MNRIFCLIFFLLIPFFILAESPNSIPQKKDNKPTLIVFNISTEKGVEVGAANLLTEFILTEIANIGRYTVIGQNDLDKMLFWETNKQLKNCTDSSCMAQIAGAMGAEYYVIGSIGVMGDNFLINLKMINVLKALVEKRVTEVVKKDENELIKVTKEIVKKLFDLNIQPVVVQKDEKESKKEVNQVETLKEEPAIIKETEKPQEVATKNKWIGYSLIGTGVIGIAAGGFFTKAAFDADDKYKSSATDAEKYNQQREDNNRNALISYIAGATLITGGIVYLFWGSKEKESPNEKKVSVNLSAYYLSISGKF